MGMLGARFSGDESPVGFTCLVLVPVPTWRGVGRFQVGISSAAR